MIETLRFELAAPAGGRLFGLVDLPSAPVRGEAQRLPAIVVSHGFKGFMEWGFFPALARLLAERGFVVVRFNFSGSGMLPGEDRVSDPEAFRMASFSRDLADLGAVVDSVDSEIAPGRVDLDRIGLFGHSRGGGISLLAAAGSSRFRALVTWAAVGTFDRVPEPQKSQWRETGEIIVVNGRTGQELPVDISVLEDLEARGPSLDPMTAATATDLPPWLIVHGTKDETVPLDEASTLNSLAAGNSELLAIRNAGHTFEVGHPFAGPSPHLIEALNATQAWFRRYL